MVKMVTRKIRLLSRHAVNYTFSPLNLLSRRNARDDELNIIVKVSVEDTLDMFYQNLEMFLLSEKYKYYDIPV
jgi:hypothetical protein